METINKHNYEAYFLDYSEGNLSESVKRELIRFLEQNPGLKEELENFEEFTLTPPEIKFNNKQELIKKTQAQHYEITEFEYLCTASLENDITESEKKRLNKELKNKEKQKEFKIYSETKLQADTSIQFQNKNALYKKSVALRYRTLISIASAAVIFLFFIFKGNIFLNDKTQNKTARLSYEKTNNIHTNIISNKLKTNLYDKTHTQQEQALVTHNQTIKNSTNNVLAFEDEEPRNIPDLYKELTVSIPEIKSEALISNIKNEISPNYIPVSFASNIDNNQTKKRDQFWKYAEKGVNIWKKITKDDDILLKNEYAENGSINEVNFIASNFQFRKTYYKK